MMSKWTKIILWVICMSITVSVIIKVGMFIYLFFALDLGGILQ